MKAIPLVVPQSVRGLASFCERAGIGTRVPASTGSGNGLLPLAYAGRLFEDLARVLGEEGVGLRVGGATRFEDSPLGRHVAGSFTVGAALAAAARTSSLYCGGQRLWMTERHGTVWLQRRFPNALTRGRRQSSDFALQLLLDLIRRAAGPSWRPADLHLEGPPPGHAEELAALAARSTRFGATADGLVFTANTLALPLPAAALGPAFAPLPALDLVDSVRLAIRCLLEVGELTLPNAAETTGASMRSLQRRLAARGLSFARLVDEARFEAASHLLQNPDARVIDIAAALGYSDSANFTRAFRRWTGVSPLAFRRANEHH